MFESAGRDNNPPTIETGQDSTAEDFEFRQPHDGIPNVVTTEEELAEAIERLLSGTGPVGVDTERASGFRYLQRAYLIQLFREDAGVVILDPTCFDNLSALQSAIKQIEWTLHAASQDLPSLKMAGLMPEKIFDTELAARLLGLPRVGLGPLVEDVFGIHLAKAHSAADWSTRPLPDSWLAYAALDVELLPQLEIELAKRLELAGKTELAWQEFEHVRLAPDREKPAEPWRSLSGIHTLHSPEALAIARELWIARDAYAAETDIAPGRILPDAAIIAAAQLRPKTKTELHSAKAFYGRESRTQFGRWWKAIEMAASTELPRLRVPLVGTPPAKFWAQKNPEAYLRLKAARLVVAQIAEQHEMPVENLLTPSCLREICWNHEQATNLDELVNRMTELDARPWQIDLVADAILPALNDPETVIAELDQPAKD